VTSFESDVLFEIADALRTPVVILVVATLAWVLVELGAFVAELLRRRRRDFGRLEHATLEARGALLGSNDTLTAQACLMQVAWSTAMGRALTFFVTQWGRPGSRLDDRLAKGLADFDFSSQRRLERTRMLVRFGPALGLMGTLIPLSPALAGLANGDVETLSENLRVAFSVTVIGLLVGAVAFAVSLVRDRLYGQDLSDLEFVAATLAQPAPAMPPAPVEEATA